MPPAKQLVLFCLVGVMTTLVDFSVFNLLTRPAVGWRRIPANLVSVSIAMAWSFWANGFVVFHPGAPGGWPRAGRFLLATAFSAFGLQNIILYLTGSVWKGPARAAFFVVRQLGWEGRLSEDIVSRNTAKALAVSAGLLWNFCCYKYFVYAK